MNGAKPAFLFTISMEFYQMATLSLLQHQISSLTTVHKVVFNIHIFLDHEKVVPTQLKSIVVEDTIGVAVSKQNFSCFYVFQVPDPTVIIALANEFPAPPSPRPTPPSPQHISICEQPESQIQNSSTPPTPILTSLSPSSADANNFKLIFKIFLFFQNCTRELSHGFSGSSNLRAFAEKIFLPKYPLNQSCLFYLLYSHNS